MLSVKKFQYFHHYQVINEDGDVLDLICGELSELDNGGELTGKSGYRIGERVGTMYMWQAWKTYDSLDKKESEENFSTKMELFMSKI